MMLKYPAVCMNNKYISQLTYPNTYPNRATIVLGYSKPHDIQISFDLFCFHAKNNLNSEKINRRA